MNKNAQRFKHTTNNEEDGHILSIIEPNDIYGKRVLSISLTKRNQGDIWEEISFSLLKENSEIVCMIPT